MDFEAASESLDGGIRVVSVRGEVDLATGPALERALRALPEDGAASAVVDLTDCSFMDSTGLRLLTRTQRRFDRSDGHLAVVAPNRNVRRVFEITRLDQILALYPSRAAALHGDVDH